MRRYVGANGVIMLMNFGKKVNGGSLAVRTTRWDLEYERWD